MTHPQPYTDAIEALRGGAANRDPSGREIGAERAIAAHLREHGPREGALLGAYQELIDQCEDEGVRYLAGMILEDERRHHRLIDEMLHQIESFIWEVERDPQVPYLTPRVDPELRAATDELLALEREDAKELKQLRREMRSQPDSSLLPLLVELMIHDTAKHIAILKETPRTQSGLMVRPCP